MNKLKENKKCNFENCDHEVFEKGKCVFHCEKDDWYEIKNSKKDWSKSEDKVKKFWEEIREKNKSSSAWWFSKYIFPVSDSVFLEDKIKNKELKWGDVKDLYFEFGWNFKKPVEVETAIFRECVFLDKVNFNERIKILNNILFDKIKFFGGFSIYFENVDKVGFREVDFREVSLSFWRDIDKIKELDSIFLNDKGELFDEMILNQEDNPRLDEYRTLEKLYLALQKNFAKKGEIAESVKFAKGKLRVAEKRIKKFSKNEFDRFEQLEFLYSEMKKRYDDLSLYSELKIFMFKKWMRN